MHFVSIVAPSFPPSRAGVIKSRLALMVAWVATLMLSAAAAVAQPTSTATWTTDTTPALRINEVFANGTTPDFIELYNAGAAAADLTGMSLTDDSAPVRKFDLAGSIAAGSYRIIYADNNTSVPDHAGFALDAEGDQVTLHSPSGAILDRISFGYQASNLSISRTGGSANVWALTTPTPGAANGAALATDSVAALKINEWAGKITYRLDHDMIELFNSSSQPIALGGVRLTDDPARTDPLKFAVLSFMAARAYLPLFGADFEVKFKIDGDDDNIYAYGENGVLIDQARVLSQPRDQSTGRIPDGTGTPRNFEVPSPGISNETPLPAAYPLLLSGLRVTEIMYQPTGSGDYEFIELQNIGSAELNLEGVRFTNGLKHVFPAGTRLAPGAFLVLARNRAAFLSRYPSAASVLAPGEYTPEALDNTGETIALTLPAPWDVHILNFRYEPTWFPSTKGGGYSLVVPSPASIAAADWGKPSTWRASAAVNGSPGAADAGGAAAATSRIINLSILTPIEASGDNFTMGYVVGGTGTTGDKPLVIRAAGPSLGALGVAGTLADPKFELFAGSTKTGENNDWGGSSSLANAMAAVGAFAYMAPNSLDAAAAVSISTRDNSVKVSANGNGTGLVIAEVYDATPEASVTASTPRLINVSVLKNIGSGLTAGFVVRGTASKTVLIRAIGPTLGAAPFNVPGIVSDPQLTLYRGQTSIGTNNNWGGTAALTAAFGQVGAFALPNGSADAALLATLEPGEYTVVVSGVAGASGAALVEVYDVP